MIIKTLFLLSHAILTASAFFYPTTNPVGSVDLASFPWSATLSAPSEFSGFTLDIAWNITNGNTLFMAMRLQSPIGGSVLGQSYATVGIGYGMLDSKAEFFVCHNNQDGQGNVVIHEHYSAVTYAPPLLSTTPAIKPILGQGDRHSQICLFSRPLDPKDGDHLAITPSQPMKWVWSFNSNPNSNLNYMGKPFTYHGSKRGAMDIVLEAGSVVPRKVSSFNTKILHGFGMMFTWLVVIPFAIYYAHFFRSYMRWMYVKVALVLCGVVFSLLFLVIVLTDGVQMDSVHGIWGICIFCLLFVQICLGTISVLGLTKERFERVKRFSGTIHKVIGYITYGAGMAQIGLGINILYPWVEPREIFPWILFIGGGGAWILIFLVGDIWRWSSRKQSVEDRITNALEKSGDTSATIKGKGVDEEQQLERFTWKSLDAAVMNEGRMLVVGNGKYVYDISQWIHSHPGGQIILQTVNGTDITNDYFNESGFDAESVTFSKNVPKRVNPTAETTEAANFSAGQSRADMIAVKRQSLNLSISSSEAVQPLQNVQFSKEEWSVIQRSRRTHVHSLAAVKRLASLVVGRLLTDTYSTETLNAIPPFSEVQGQHMFDLYEYRRYALVSKTQQDDFKHYYKLKFCLLYPYDTRKGEPQLFFPGQSIQIEVRLANGKRISRYYTPISGSLSSFEILVKRKIGTPGEMSNFLANSHQGERQFKIRGPFGSAFLPSPYHSKSLFQRKPETIIFIAGGSGITPFIQLATHLFLPTNFGLKVCCCALDSPTDLFHYNILL